MTTPKIEEDLSYERLFAEKLSTFTQSYKSEQPSFQSPLPVDPVYRALSELCMTEIMIRARINAAAVAQLLKLTEDLDFLFFGLRRETENLEAFRERMRLNLHKASPAGPLEMYKSLALAAANSDADSIEKFPVVDAFVRAADDLIQIHLQPNLKVGADIGTIIEKVSNFLNQDHIRPAFDEVVVQAATPKMINVAAQIKLAPGKGLALLGELRDSFAAALLDASRLGWSMPLSWAYAQLHRPGECSALIDTPITEVPAGTTEYLVLGGIVLRQAA